MLKFDKSNDDLNTPFDTGILDGLSDPILIVNENYTIVHYNRAFRRILEADPLSTALVRTVRSAGYSLDITPNIM